MLENSGEVVLVGRIPVGASAETQRARKERPALVPGRCSPVAPLPES